MIDDGQAIHYTAVARGTAVYGSDGVRVGEVEAILDNYEQHIFDGVVIRAEDGELRFADAPEVQRTAERGVTLAIPAADAANLPPPDEGHARFKPNLSKGRVSRLFGRGWKRH